MDQLSGLDNMQLEHVAATGRGPFDGIEDPVGFRTSCNRYSRHFMDCSIHEAAGSRGVDVLLSGIFGEYTISAKPGPYLLEFASQMRFATLLRELRCQSEMLNHSRVRRFAAQAWHHMIPGSPGPDTVFLRSEFVRQFAPKSLGRSPLWPSTQRTELKRVNDLLNIDAFSSTVPRNVAFATAIPFRDRRLLEFCLALPAEYKVRNGFSRYLLRRSFESVLPRSIAWRTTKMPYSPDYASRYNSQINKAREFVNSISRSDPVADLVDIERLRRATNPVGSDRNSSMVALLPVPRSIYLINFLRHFPAFRV
jgi:asparagine synthase (glutamine-hydrolysing)